MHIQRELENALLAALTELAGYRRARWRAVILYGLAGSGKTALARALAEAPQFRRAFREGVLWVNGRRPPAAEAARLCLALGLPPLPGERPVETWQRWAGEPGRRFLLVIDDAADGAAVQPLVAQLGPQVVALITTQQGLAVRAEVERWLPADQVLELAVSGLTPAEDRQLVEAVADQPLTTADWDLVQALGELVGWHPEALRLAAIEGRAIGWPGLLGELQAGRLPWRAVQRLIRRRWARLPADQQAWLDPLCQATAPGAWFTAATAAQLWCVAEAVAARRLWLLHYSGWVESSHADPAQPDQWQVARLAQRTAAACRR